LPATPLDPTLGPIPEKIIAVDVTSDPEVGPDGRLLHDVPGEEQLDIAAAESRLGPDLLHRPTSNEDRK
jgi:hypothetical protein